MAISTARVAHAEIALPIDQPLRLAVVADTHSAPHAGLLPLLREHRPHAILHAGDIGDLAVLAPLATIATLHAVRGNIDEKAPDLPDVLLIDLTLEGNSALRILLTHIAVNGARLRADARRTAKHYDAALVICGHSHVPLIASDGGVGIFNPGSVGPRRFHLPIVFGLLEVSAAGIRYEHIDVETSRRWLPGAS